MNSQTRKNILIIGAGVSGLTTAFELQEAGHQVTIVAEKPATETVSMIAGALWEWPPAVCGFHSDVQSLERSKSWSATTYHELTRLSQRVDVGVAMLPSYFYFHRPVQDSDFDFGKMKEIESLVAEFRHDPAMISENKINPELGLVDSYVYVAPVVHTRTYLTWMRNHLENAGVRFVKRRIAGPIEEQVDLLAEFDADWMINCSGLGARELGDDTMYPLRGALVRMLTDNDPSVLNAAHCISHDDSSPQQNMIYVVPRGDHLLLGGIAQPDQWDTDIGLDNCETIKQILERCLEFMPRLRELDVDASEPVRCGLRPARQQNVRLEADSANPIIHNYGHGGSGFSFSWGCAKEVANMIEQS